MLDGFNEAWINFESGPDGSRKGKITLMAALPLRSLVSDLRS